MPAKVPTPEEERNKLYALRRTDYGFKGKTTERAITGGYTRPPHDETIVREGKARHLPLKPARGSARPSGYHAVQVGAVEDAALRSLAGEWRSRRKARLAKLHARRAK